jgi:hypothetical protein
MIDKTYQLQPYISDEELIFFVLRKRGKEEKKVKYEMISLSAFYSHPYKYGI